MVSYHNFSFILTFLCVQYLKPFGYCAALFFMYHYFKFIKILLIDVMNSHVQKFHTLLAVIFFFAKFIHTILAIYLNSCKCKQFYGFNYYILLIFIIINLLFNILTISCLFLFRVCLQER